MGRLRNKTLMLRRLSWKIVRLRKNSLRRLRRKIRIYKQNMRMCLIKSREDEEINVEVDDDILKVMLSKMIKLSMQKMEVVRRMIKINRLILEKIRRLRWFNLSKLMSKYRSLIPQTKMMKINNICKEEGDFNKRIKDKQEEEINMKDNYNPIKVVETLKKAKAKK